MPNKLICRVTESGKLGPCQHCRNLCENLYSVNISDGQKEKDYLLCRDCAKTMYYKVSQKNEAAPENTVRNTYDSPSNQPVENTKPQNTYAGTICPNCGCAVSPQAVFCNKCGGSITAAQSTPAHKGSAGRIIAIVSAAVIVLLAAVIFLPQLVKSIQKSRNATSDDSSYSDSNEDVVDGVFVSDYFTVEFQSLGMTNNMSNDFCAMSLRIQNKRNASVRISLDDIHINGNSYIQSLSYSPHYFSPNESKVVYITLAENVYAINEIKFKIKSIDESTGEVHTSSHYYYINLA